jgi:hypothetical protein
MYLCDGVALTAKAKVKHFISREHAVRCNAMRCDANAAVKKTSKLVVLEVQVPPTVCLERRVLTCMAAYRTAS